MAVNADNALIFSSDDDSLWLTDYDKDFATKVTGLTSDLTSVAGLTNVGWLHEDGVKLAFDDSLTKIKGHQGHGVVKTFLDSSESSISATLLETLLKPLTWYLDATAEKVEETKAGGGGEKINVAKITAKSSRKVKVLSGVADLFDVSGVGAHVRIVFPRLELGERGEITFQQAEITGYEFNLSILGDYIIYSDHKALIPA
jgi:hypothetical protein